MTLTRIQSGIGVLTVETAHSAAVGDLRTGCAYSLRSGSSSVLHNVGTPTSAPPGSNRPVIVLEPAHNRFTLDLTQSRDVDRLIIYAFSGGGPPPTAGVTLITTTFGRARIETTLDRLPPTGVVVLMSLYNIAGEFVLRAELDLVAGTPRDAAAGYGFDQITWLDPWTPLDVSG